MKKTNVTEVRRLVEMLDLLKDHVKADKVKTVEMITEIRSKLDKILDEEETSYIEQNCPDAEVAVINDESLNMLSEAIGILEERMNYPNQIIKHLDDAVEKLKACITD